MKKQQKSWIDILSLKKTRARLEQKRKTHNIVSTQRVKEIEEICQTTGCTHNGIKKIWLFDQSFIDLQKGTFHAASVKL